MRSAAAETDVRIDLPTHVEFLWRGEYIRIAVGRGIEHHDLVASRYWLAAEFGIAHRSPAEHVDRADPSHDLLGRCWDQARIVTKPLPLLWMLEQGQDSPGRGVARRLVACDREQQEEQVEFVARQCLAVLVRLQQLRDDVVRGLGSAPLGAGRTIRVTLCRGRLLRAVRDLKLWISRSDEQVRKFEDPCSVLNGRTF